MGYAKIKCVSLGDIKVKYGTWRGVVDTMNAVGVADGAGVM